jgi:hypothetical protein
MKPVLDPIDLGGVKTYPLAERPGKVGVAEFAVGWTPGGSLAAFLERLPQLLAGSDLNAVIAAIISAHRRQRPVIFGLGAHVIKVGIRHYRPMVNVVQRPTARGGRGISLIGQHEILLPLIAAGVIEALG